MPTSIAKPRGLFTNHSGPPIGMRIVMRAQERRNSKGLWESQSNCERTQRMTIREVSILEVSTKAFHFRTADDARLTFWKGATYRLYFANPNCPPLLRDGDSTEGAGVGGLKFGGTVSMLFRVSNPPLPSLKIINAKKEALILQVSTKAFHFGLLKN